MPHTPAYLVLQARFLAGRYGGTEWPPAPFRLLQAMVAGLRTIDHPGLRWYEAQGAPVILAEPAPAVVRLRRAVPNNADPGNSKAHHALRPVARREVRQPVRYAYALPHGADPASLGAALEAAHAVHTLGTGEDMCAVEGRVCHHPPEAAPGTVCWQPGHRASPVQLAGDLWLQVPMSGSLASLEARFQAFQQRLDQHATGYSRPVLPPARHALATYRSSADVPRSAVVPLRLVAPGTTGRPARFHAEHAVVVGGMLRHATMRLAGDGPLADFAAGYGPADDPDRRLSWVPLPSVGHQHADGQVRRGLVLARAADLPAFSALLAGLPEDGLALVDEQSGKIAARAHPLGPDEDAALAHYLGEAAMWCTVTPMIMPGDYAGSPRLLNRLLLKALRESGIDPGLLVHAEFSREGFLPQAVRIPHLKLKDWKARHLVLQHVRLRFAQPLRGPLVLGRGRHYGVGLFCANPQ